MHRKSDKISHRFVGVRLHFGRFRTAPVWQALWVPLGLVPAAMFITGGFMWFNRVLRKRSLERAA